MMKLTMVIADVLCYATEDAHKNKFTKIINISQYIIILIQSRRTWCSIV